jgi:hypothetical protein
MGWLGVVDLEIKGVWKVSGILPGPGSIYLPVCLSFDCGSRPHERDDVVEIEEMESLVPAGTHHELCPLSSRVVQLNT